MAAEAPSKPQVSWFERLMLRLSTSRFVGGLRIAAGEHAGENALQRIEAALNLIKHHDRRRYERIRKDVELIWVRLLPGVLARWSDALHACELDTRFVLDESSTPDIIASVIVHEATHARLARYGIGYDEGRRERIEAICVRRELVFAARLPDGERLRAWVMRHIHPSPEVLTDAAFAKRTHEGDLQALRYMGTPEWVLRAVLAVAAARMKLLRLFRLSASASN